jgi:hypothetical protein
MALSVGEAAFSGFKLIGQKPLTVLVWGLTYMVFLGAPAALFWVWFGPDYIQFIRSTFEHAGSPAASTSPFGAMWPFMQKMQVFSSIFSLFSIVVRAVLMTAVLRAILTPEDKNFRLFESWKATKGHVGGLFLIVLLLLVLIWLIELVVGGTMFAIAFSNAQGLKAFFARPPEEILHTAAPLLIGGVVVGSILSGAALAVFMAPFATAYRQIVGPVDRAAQAF